MKDKSQYTLRFVYGLEVGAEYEQTYNINDITVKEAQREIGAEYILTYTFNRRGQILVRADYTPTTTDIPLMPKFGMRMRMPAQWQQIEWVGRGPLENYPDRKTSQFVGRYKSTVRDFGHDYIRPQDNGYRTDVRWFTLSDGRYKMKISAVDPSRPLCFNVWDYGEEDIEGTAHPHELKRGKFINVNIDSHVHGLGGKDTWGGRTLPEYTIDGNKPQHLEFVISLDE